MPPRRSAYCILENIKGKFGNKLRIALDIYPFLCLRPSYTYDLALLRYQPETAMIAVEWTKVHPTFDLIGDSVAVRLCESIHCEVFYTQLITIFSNGLFNYKLQLQTAAGCVAFIRPR